MGPGHQSMYATTISQPLTNIYTPYQMALSGSIIRALFVCRTNVTPFAERPQHITIRTRPTSTLCARVYICLFGIKNRCRLIDTTRMAENGNIVWGWLCVCWCRRHCHCHCRCNWLSFRTWRQNIVRKYTQINTANSSEGFTIKHANCFLSFTLSFCCCRCHCRRRRWCFFAAVVVTIRYPFVLSTHFRFPSSSFPCLLTLKLCVLPIRIVLIFIYTPNKQRRQRP